MDAFYASIEQRDHPGYRDKPVIVGAQPGTRGVVSAASYEARKFGVHSAMPIATAYRLCPKGIYLRPDMTRYVEASKIIMGILAGFSPQVEPLSVDEAFLNFTGMGKLFPSPLSLAETLRGRILKETQLSCSIGLAPNKFLAKLCSGLFKPARISFAPFPPDAVLDFLKPMPIRYLWGVGEQTRRKLNNMGLTLIGDLQALKLSELEKALGSWGTHLFYLSRGLDEREVVPRLLPKSISREHTFPKDCRDRELWWKTLLGLSRGVAEQTRRQGLRGRVVYFTYRTSDFKRRTRRKKLGEPTDSAQRLYREARVLAEKALGKSAMEEASSLPSPRPSPSSPVQALRLLGVGLTDFVNTEQAQLDLWRDLQREDIAVEKQRQSERAMDAVSQKFGRHSIFFGGEV